MLWRISKHTLNIYNNNSSANHADNEVMWEDVVDPEQAAGENITWHVRIACWIPKATSTHPEYVILIRFPLTHGCRNAPECYAVRALPVLFFPCSEFHVSRTHTKFFRRFRPL